MNLRDRSNFDEYVHGAKNSTFYGQPLDSLKRDELLYMIYWLMLDSEFTRKQKRSERAVWAGLRA